MKIVKTISEIRDIVKEWKKSGYSIGLVPTMGYLHAGHGSLIEQSVKNNDKTVVSVFVNPTQFGPNEDLEKYPRDIKRDSELVSSLGGDIIFNLSSWGLKQEEQTGLHSETLISPSLPVSSPPHMIISLLFVLDRVLLCRSGWP